MNHTSDGSIAIQTDDLTLCDFWGLLFFCIVIYNYKIHVESIITLDRRQSKTLMVSTNVDQN